MAVLNKEDLKLVSQLRRIVEKKLVRDPECLNKLTALLQSKDDFVIVEQFRIYLRNQLKD